MNFDGREGRDYPLTEGRVAGVEDTVPNTCDFDRTLELSEPPWPSKLNLPYHPPRVFYGRVPTADEQGASPASTTDV